MRYEESLNFEGSAFQGEPGDGRAMLVFDGSGEPAQSTDLWQMHAEAVWSQSAGGRPSSAEIRIDGPLGGGLSGQLRGGNLTVISDARGRNGAARFALSFTVREGSGRFQGSAGIIDLNGTMESGAFLATATLRLDTPEGVWQPPKGRALDAAELDSGASAVGPQPLSQEAAEHQAESSLLPDGAQCSSGSSSKR